MQFLLDDEGCHRLEHHHVEQWTRWTSTREFVQLIDDWNIAAEISVAFEPFTYPAVFRRTRVSAFYDRASILDRRNRYKSSVRSILAETDQEFLEGVRGQLCRAAEAVDGNKMLHVLLRLTRWHCELSLKDAIGACMLLRSMAEVIWREVRRHSFRCNFRKRMSLTSVNGCPVRGRCCMERAVLRMRLDLSYES